ncbi:MAG: protein kinase domain-containing protein [Phycisphaeraceae bacterium]
MTNSSPQTDPAVTSLTAKAGDKVDNYTIMEQVGAGGTAIVFRGHDHVLNRNVAIKQLVVPPGDAGDDVRQRALAESRMHKQAAASDPKLLVQYIDTINDPRGLFLISEYVDGPSLEWILQQETGPMDQRQALGIIAATAKALAALHQAGVVHRDLKPSNILMPREGGLKLADFGLASLIADQQSLDLGSVRYMAPEVLQGEPASPKSDLYSLGMIAYEMLAGRDHFNEAFRTILRDQRNQSMRWVKWHTNVRAKVTPLNQLVDGVPESLSQLVGRMMEKDPARRVGSATELIEAIRSHFAAGGQAQPTPAPHAAMAPPKIDDVSQTAAVPQKSKLPLILAATLAVWVLAIGGFFVWKQQQDKQAAEARRVALIQDIKAADEMILDRDFAAARDAFARIPTEHAGMFNPNQRGFRGDLVEAGKLKAEALLAAKNKDFISAYDKASRYKKLMDRHPDQTTSFRTSLSSADAEKLANEYVNRKAVQEELDRIAALLDDNELEPAIEAIRVTRQQMTDSSAAEDRARLDELEARHAGLQVNQAVLDLLAKAEALLEAGELNDAIEVLEDEIDRAGDNVDERITARLAELNKAALIKKINLQIARAERSGDDAELLSLYKDLQREQPTQGLAEKINALEIKMRIEQAEEALAENKPEKAQQYLADVLERDPNNAQAKRMLASIADAKAMIEADARGDRFFAEGNYPAAIAAWREAMTFGPDSTGRINDKIRNATGLIHQANTQAALDAGDVNKAQDEHNSAVAMLGDTDALRALQQRIDNLRDYTLLVDEGDALLAKNSFGRAKAKYLAAKKIFDNEAINEKIRDCDFGIWLEQCDQAIINRNWEEAEGALNRAEEIRKNEQTRARREKINNRVQ